MKITFLSKFILASFLAFCFCSCTNEEVSVDNIQKGVRSDTLQTKTHASHFFEIPNSKTDSIEQGDTLSNEVLPTPEMQLFVYESGDAFGYKNKEGEVVLNAKYRMANEFMNGMAEVVDEEGWAYVNGRGEVIARPFIYDNGPDYFKEGMARFVEDEQIGFLNEAGRKVITAQFDFAHPFSAGLAAACMGCEKKKFTTESGEHYSMEGGKWGFIDKSGAWVIPCLYEEVRDFEDGRGAYKDQGKWVEINAKGEIQ